MDSGTVNASGLEAACGVRTHGDNRWRTRKRKALDESAKKTERREVQVPMRSPELVPCDDQRFAAKNRYDPCHDNRQLCDIGDIPMTSSEASNARNSRAACLTAVPILRVPSRV